ncbi:hypothetical protein MASR2M78_07450 [Treponema sp.]
MHTRLWNPCWVQSPTQIELTESFTKLDYTGRFEGIRIRQDPIEAGAPLLVKLQEVKKDPTKLRLGVAYRTTMSDSITNDLDFSSSLLFNGLTTEDSQLRIRCDTARRTGIRNQL